MKNKAGSPRDILARAGRILEGKIRPDVEEIFDLISRINPTDRGLPEKEARARYGIKSKLQSVLLRGFESKLEVEPDATDPDIVGLRHRATRASAGHARLSELDPDARSRVQFLLDTDAAATGAQDASIPARNSPPATREKSGPQGRVASLRQGRALLEEFDYEGARVAIEVALLDATAAGDVATELTAARLLLELLVETLAANEDACAVADRISSSALDDPEILSLVALARARCGDIAASLTAARGLDLPRVADIFAAVARRRIEAGDAKQARSAVEELRNRHPGHPRLETLQAKLEHLVQERVRNLRDVLAVHLDAGQWGDAEGVARRVLAEHPGDEEARQALRRVSAELRQIAVAEGTEAALAALATGNLARARAALKELEDMREPRPELTAQLEAATDREQKARLEAAVRHLRERLAAGDLGGALAIYVDAGDDQRQVLRSQASHPAFEWIESLGARPRRRSALTRTIEATLALDAASGMEEEDAADRILEILRPHATTLDGLARYHEVLAGAEQRLREQQQRTCARSLEQAAAALAGGDYERAGSLLDSIHPGDLDAAAKHRYESLTSDLERIQSRRALEESWRRARDHGALLEARSILDEIVAGLSADEAEPWTARRQELTAAINSSFGLRRWDVAREDWTPVDDLRLGGGEVPLPLLSATGEDLVMVAIRDRWVLVQLLDTTTARVQSIIALRTPAAFSFPEIARTQDSLWMVDGAARTLRLGLDSEEILLWDELADLVPPDASIEDILVTPGQRFIWIACTHRWERSDTGLRIIDLERRTAARHLREQGALQHVRLRGKDCVATLPYDDSGVALHDEQGRRLTADDLPPRGRIHCALPMEDEWVMVSSLEEGEDLELTRVQIVLRESGGDVQVLRELADAWADGAMSLGASDTTLSLLYIDLDQEHRLLIIRRRGATWDEQFSGAVPRKSALIGDHQGRCRGLYWLDAERGANGYSPIDKITDEGGGWPEDTDPAPRESLPLFLPHVGIPRDPLIAQLQGELEFRPGDDRRAWGYAFLAEHIDEADALVALYQAARLAHHPELHERVAREWSRFPNHPQVCIILAEAAAGRGDWSQVTELLADIDPWRIEDERSLELVGLQALALMRQDRHSEALQLIERGPEGEAPPERLSALQVLARRVLGDPPPATMTEAALTTNQVLDVIIEADRLLAEGRASAAAEAIEAACLHERLEIQLTARWAAARLEVAGETGAAWVRTVLALSSFLDAMSSSWPRELPLGRLGWSPEQLAMLRTRVSSWLDAQ